MDKKQMRQQVINMRNAMHHQDHQSKSDRITETFLSLPEFKFSRAIAGFVNFRSEVNMLSILQHICESHTILYLPRIDVATGEMTFYHVSDITKLVENSYGILEPSPNHCDIGDISLLSTVLTPGVAFTKKGDRLGYGGGYYDRFFRGLSEDVQRIGIAFDFQLVDTIPSESHDVQMHRIITDERMIDCHLHR